MRGNPQILFGKRPTEKDLAKGTSPAVHFTLRGGGAATRPGYLTDRQLPEPARPFPGGRTDTARPILASCAVRLADASAALPA